MMARGEFREDLYYRLKVIEVTVPPLRERRSEIHHLTDFFMDRYARRYNRPVRQLSPELHQLFLTYEWPGNIRELENMMKRLVILQDEQLVIREIARTAKPVAAFAARRRQRVPHGVPIGRSRVEPDEFEIDDDEEPAATSRCGAAPADPGWPTSRKPRR